MPKSVLTRKRSLIARIAVLAMIFSLMAVALPASAHSVALDTTGPCPAATPSAGFTDIGAFDATTQTAINCLFAFGITVGTSATTYSPNDTITRWQMALFLIRQAADHGITIPAPVSQGYTDIGAFDTATQNAINQITQLGISKGTSSTTFSPNAGVTRWQMALFIHRTGLVAGVTFVNNPAHNEFLDIVTLSTEAQTSINALADTEADPNGHIALGTGLSLYSPDLVLVRWQMALFLTRLLAADDVPAPAGIRVTVTPSDAATQSGLTARAYTATFRNLDGTPYTGAVGVTLRAVTAGVIQYDNVPAATSIIQTPSDGLAGAGTQTVEGFPGTDGVVTFVVRHVGGTETVVPIAWEDLNNDNDPEITGNAAPTEPFGLGGTTTFSAPAPEAAAGAFAVDVVSNLPASDSFVGDPGLGDCGNGVGVDCTFNYDSGDLFLIEGVPVADLATFEAALNAGDVVDGIYAPASADQSTFDMSTDNPPGLTVTDPAAAIQVDAFSYPVVGTAAPNFTIRIYADLNNDGDASDAGEGLVATGTAAGDGAWTVAVPLTQNAANDFVVAQRSTPTGTDSALVDVPTITEGPAAGAQLAAGNTWVDTVLADGVLDPGDVITLNFNETVAAPGAGDTVELSDGDGTSVRLTCGNQATCAAVDADTISVTVDLFPETLLAGATGGLQSPAQINVLGGFVGTDGLAVNVAGSPGANRLLTET